MSEARAKHMTRPPVHYWRLVRRYDRATGRLGWAVVCACGRTWHREAV